MNDDLAEIFIRFQKIMTNGRQVHFALRLQRNAGTHGVRHVRRRDVRPDE